MLSSKLVAYFLGGVVVVDDDERLVLRLLLPVDPFFVRSVVFVVFIESLVPVVVPLFIEPVPVEYEPVVPVPVPVVPVVVPVVPV
jgi:hypothetical protein